METITFNVDEKVLEEATKLFEELGLDVETAVNMFLRKSIIFGGIPFKIELNNLF